MLRQSIETGCRRWRLRKSRWKRCKKRLRGKGKGGAYLWRQSREKRLQEEEVEEKQVEKMEEGN